jgi:chaperonin GroES
MKIKPSGNRVIVEPINTEEVKKIGEVDFILPDSEKKEPNQGVVVALGSGVIINGKEIPIAVKIGDKIIFTRFASKEVSIDKKKYLIVAEKDILAILE